MIKSPRNFVLVFIFFIFFLLFIYNFSYLFPFTNNAFVISDISPVASKVDGTIEEIYIKNGEMVKKGQPLLKINQKLHLYEYRKVKNDLVTAKLYLQNLKNESEILVQKSKINSLILKKKLAKAKLHATVLYAENDGYVNNLFFDVGTPVKAYEPFFSFVSTNQLYVQANMSELDLRNVKPSQKVSIIPRIYLGSKVYHGEVISTNWASSRQVTNARNQTQIVTNNEDNWILLPQRFPVLIKITDYDAVNFPLNVGNSVYIYIHSH